MYKFSVDIIHSLSKTGFSNIKQIKLSAQCLGFNHESLKLFSVAAIHIDNEIEREMQPKSQHIYKEVFPWRSNSELSKYIVSNAVIYNSGSLVAINKPYGLGIRSSLAKQSSGQTKKVVQTLNTVLCSSYSGDLTRILPLVAKELGFERLGIIKTPERFTSGVTLLSADEKLDVKIRKCFRRTKPLKQPCEEYLAVTVGVPVEREASKKVGLVLQTSESLGNKQPIIMETVSQNSIDHKKSKLVMVNHKTVSVNDALCASLVQISPSVTSWHFLRVYLASLLSPVLGDNVHGSRVTFKNLPPKLVNPFSHLAQLPQELPPGLLASLGLHRGQRAIVPVHLHLSKLTIPGFFNHSEDLVIQAPVSQSFVWTCEQLGLKLPQ